MMMNLASDFSSRVAFLDLVVAKNKGANSYQDSVIPVVV